MLKLKVKLVLFAMIGLLLAGCATTGNRKLANFDESKTNQIIVNGKTKQTQVTAALGEPNNVSYTDNGNEIWTYQFTKHTPKAINFVPYANLVSRGTNDQDKKIVILFDKHHVVKHHRFTMSKGETNLGLIT